MFITIKKQETSCYKKKKNMTRRLSIFSSHKKTSDIKLLSRNPRSKIRRSKTFPKHVTIPNLVTCIRKQARVSPK